MSYESPLFIKYLKVAPYHMDLNALSYQALLMSFDTIEFTYFELFYTMKMNNVDARSDFLSAEGINMKKDQSPLSPNTVSEMFKLQLTD